MLYWYALLVFRRKNLNSGSNHTAVKRHMIQKAKICQSSKSDTQRENNSLRALACMGPLWATVDLQIDPKWQGQSVRLSPRTRCEWLSITAQCSKLQTKSSYDASTTSNHGLTTTGAQRPMGTCGNSLDFALKISSKCHSFLPKISQEVGTVHPIAMGKEEKRCLQQTRRLQHLKGLVMLAKLNLTTPNEPGPFMNTLSLKSSL